MNKFTIIYICSLVLATGSFAQTPTVSPIASTPGATAAISATSTPASKIEQSIRKKHKKHFGFTIDDHDKDLDALDHLGEEPGMNFQFSEVIVINRFKLEASITIILGQAAAPQ